MVLNKFTEEAVVASDSTFRACLRGLVKPIELSSGLDSNTNYKPNISLDTLIATYKYALRLCPTMYGVLYGG